MTPRRTRAPRAIALLLATALALPAGRALADPARVPDAVAGRAAAPDAAPPTAGAHRPVDRVASRPAPPSLRPTPPAAPPAAAVATVAAPDPAAEPPPGALPVERRQGRVRVRAEAGLEAKAAAIAARADATLALIADDLAGLPTPAVVDLRLVHDTGSMNRVAPDGAQVPAWAVGVAFPRRGVVVVATRRGAADLDVDGTVDHELAHLALGAALGPRAPRWLHEGFAYLHSTDWSWERAQTLAGMAWFGSVISLADLELRFPAEELPASRAYAQSYDFVAFLAKRGRWVEPTDDGDRYPFQQFLAAVAEHGDLDRAAVSAYGRPLADLFDEWHVALRDRFMFLPAALALGSLWLVAIALLLLAFRRRRRQNRQRLAEWDRIERAAAEARARDGGPPVIRPISTPPWTGPGWARPGAPVVEPPAANPAADADPAGDPAGDPESDDDGPPGRAPRWLN